MDKSKIKNLYETTTLTLQQIADDLGLTYKIVWTYVKKNYAQEYRKKRKVVNYQNSKMGNKNPMKGKFRFEHPRYKEVVGDSKGYLMVLKPEWYTGRRGSNHVFLHHVIMCEALSLTEIPKGFVVHHIDENPLNNELENLVLLTMGAHTKLHWFQKKNVQRLSQTGVEDADPRSA